MVNSTCHVALLSTKLLCQGFLRIVSSYHSSFKMFFGRYQHVGETYSVTCYLTFKRWLMPSALPTRIDIMQLQLLCHED